MIKDIPTIVFGILGLSITIATFLPALVYSYNKDLLTNLIKPKFEKKQAVWRRVISFIFTNDLLLTQSMIQVFFSSIYAILIFAKYSFQQDSFWYNFIFFNFSFIVVIFHFYLAFFYSNGKILDMKKNSKNILKYFWCNYYKTYKYWYYFSLTNLIITLVFILLIFCNPFNLLTRFIITYFMSYLSFILITYSISWLIPLIVYSPLQSEVADYVDLYIDKHNKQIDKENNSDENENDGNNLSNENSFKLDECNKYN